MRLGHTLRGMSILDRLLRWRSSAPAPVRPYDAAETGERRRQPRPAAEGARILIVDDSRTVVAVLGRMMQQNKSQVFEAFTGEAALELLETQEIDLVFLDIVLPGISGFDVLRRIRRNPRLSKRVRVIVMSGNEAATQEYYVRRIGADEFLVKPSTRAMVFASVERVLGLQPFALEGKSAEANTGALVQDTEMSAASRKA